MVSAVQLDEEDPWAWARVNTPESEPGIGVGDYARAAVAGGYGVAANVAGASQYVRRFIDGADASETSDIAGVRRAAEENAEAWTRSMSPAAQRAQSAGFLPQDGQKTVWDEDVSTGGALGLKLAGALPSLAASLIPGGLVARIALSARAGMTAGGAAGGAMSGGDVFNDIQNDILKSPDDKLQAENEVYRGLRVMGMEEDEAKQRVVTQAAGYKPLYMAAITALTSRYGVEGLVARRMAGEGGRGLLRGAAKGMAGEATQEAIEEGSGELLKQAGAKDARAAPQADYDWYKALAAAVEGGVVGGLLGAGTGAVTGGGRTADVKPGTGDDAADLALSGQPMTITVGPSGVTPDTNADVDAQLGAVPDVAPPDAPAAPPDMAVVPPDVDPAVRAALVPQRDIDVGEDPDAEVAPAIPPAPRVPVVTPQVAAAITTSPGLPPVPAEATPLAGGPPAASPVGSALPVADPVTPEGNVAPAPEPTETLDAQFASALDKASPRQAVLVTPGETVKPLKGFQSIELPEGKLYVRKTWALKNGVASKAKLQAYIDANGFEGLIGKVEPVPDTSAAPAAVVTRDPGGKELAASAVTTPETAAAQAAVDQAQFPQAATQTLEAPEAVVAQRLAPEVAALRTELVDAYRQQRAIVDGAANFEAAAGPVQELAPRIADLRERVAQHVGTVAARRIADEARAEASRAPAVLQGRDEAAEQRAADFARIQTQIDEEGEVGDRGKYTTAHTRELEALGITEPLTPKQLRTWKRERAEEALAARVEAAVKATPMPPNIQGTGPKAVAAVRQYAQALSEQFKGERVSPKAKDVNLGHLRRARRVAGQGMVSRSVLEDFLTNDFALRMGDKDMLVAYNKSREGMRTAKAEGPTTTSKGAVNADEVVEVTDEFDTFTDDAIVDEGDTDITELADRAGGTGEVEANEDDGAAAASLASDDQLGTREGPEEDAETQERREAARKIAEADAEAAARREARRKEAAPAVTPSAPAPRKFEAVKGRQKLTSVGKPVDPAVIERLKARKSRERTEEARGEIREMAVTEAELAALDDDILDAMVRKAQRRAEAGPRVDVTTDLRTLMGEYGLGNVNGLNRAVMQQMMGTIRRLAGDVPVRVVDYATVIELHAGEMLRTGKSYVPHGWYDPHTDEIVLRDDSLDFMGAQLIVHEGVHAALDNALASNPRLAEEVEGLIDATRKHLATEARARGEETFKEPYGLRNAHEFVAEAMSDPDFQELLTRVQVGETRLPMSAWGRFIAMVKKTLFSRAAVTGNALERALRITGDLDTAATKGGRRRGNIVRERSAAERVADVGATLGDTGKGFKFGTRRVGLALGTIDQLRQQYDRLFEGNPIERITAALQRQAKMTGEKQEAGHQLAAEFSTLRQTDADEAQRAATLMIAATKADVNLGPNANNDHLGKNKARTRQQKAMLVRLQSDYAALKPATQDYIQRAARYYRDTQNEITRVHAEQLLETADNLTPAQRADILPRVLNGSLTEDDEKLLDNKPLFKGLHNAQQFRVIKGIYFPLMRHGDHVVQTWEKIGELHGGKVVDQPKGGDYAIIEWRAPDGSDKAARAMFEKFADDPSSLDITSVGKVRELRNGQRVSLDASTGQDHYVIYRARVQTRGTHFFDTVRAAERFRRLNRGQFADVSDVLQRADRDGNLTTGLVGSDVQALLNHIDGRSIDQTHKEMMKTAIKQAAVMRMSGTRMQHRALPRRGVKGASEDIARNTLQYANSASSYLAKLHYMPEVRDALADMRKQVPADPKLQQARGMVEAELRKRVDANVVNISEPAQLVKDIMVLSFLDKLFSPAYSVINGMQPWMVTAPYLGGRYGNMRATAALGRAYNDIAAPRQVVQGLANTGRAATSKPVLDTTNITKSIRDQLAKTDDAAGVLAVFDAWAERNGFGSDTGLEIAGAIGAGANRARRGLAYADRMARQLPMAIEDINRAVTLVATYRLAKASGATPTQAQAAAFEAVQNTQGDYSNWNAPKFFNSPWLRPALQFKKYSQMMSYLLYDMLQRMSDSNLSRRERMIAGRQMLNILGMQIAMAGAMGLPGVELIKIAAMVTSMAGLGDGWDEWERRFRKLLDDSFGKTWGELVTRGVVSRAAGIDISNRVGMGDMWLFGEPKSYDKEGMNAYLGQFFLGAPGSLLMDWVAATQDAANGRVADALTKIIPVKVMADTLKATQGRLDPQARTPLQTHEAVMTAVGIRPARVAEESEQVGDRIAIRKAGEARMKELRKAYMAAGTKAEELKIRGQMQALSKRLNIEAPRIPMDKRKAEAAERRRVLLGQ